MTSTGAFYFDLSSLDPGTTYYYRAKAVGHGYPVYGSDKCFTTHTPPVGDHQRCHAMSPPPQPVSTAISRQQGTAGSVTVSFVWGTSPGSYPNETTSENHDQHGALFR